LSGSRAGASGERGSLVGASGGCGSARADPFTRYVGWLSQEELPRQLRAADVLVMPTVAQEALGRTAVEAMAAGRPVVASRIGGLPATVLDGATGLLCEPGDPADLAAKIEALLDDDDLRERLGRAGRRRFEEHFAWDVIIERHYKPLLGPPRRAPAPSANGSRPGPGDGPVVQVVAPTDDWILERLARRLVAKLPYAEFVPWEARPAGGVRLVYYVNYALHRGPSGALDVALFTHPDEEGRFLARARAVDFCVCMSRQYADWLRARGVHAVAHVPMGFDSYRFRPRLVLGVVGLLEHPRKGRHLVERLRQLPFVEVVVSGGTVPEERLPELYQRVDYVLIPATLEGGPLSLLEGLGMGKPVIAPADVGMVPEFGDSEHIVRYPAGDAEALVRVVTACYEEKRARSRLVEDRSWDRWAEGHHRVFERLLRERGQALPVPALGFRFGLLGEIDVPPGGDVRPLEEAVDRAAAHLYYGRCGAARAALEGVLPRYPFAAKLLEGVAGGSPITSR
jgi:hypothetical protein